MSDARILKSTRSGVAYRTGSVFRLGAYTLHEAYAQHGQRCWIKQVAVDDPAAIASLRYETIILSKLEDPAVVQVLDRGRTRSCFFLALAPTTGHSLQHMLELGPPPLATVLDIARQVTELLVYLHSRGIVCRTLPPESLYFDHLGRVVLVDVSAAWDEVSPPRAGDTILNARYLSPEEAGGAAAERRSDVYVFGLLLFELLTGQPVFHGTSRGDLALQHLLTPPRALRAVLPDAAPALADIVARCLAKAPKQRYAHALELQRALEQVVAQLAPGTAAAPSRPARAAVAQAVAIP